MRLTDKLKQREYVQDKVIEIVGDIMMFVIGLIFAYHFKVMILGK